MSFWDSLTKRNPVPSSQPSSSSSNNPPPIALPTSEPTLADPANNTTFTSSFDSPSSDASDFLSAASLPDPALLHPLAGLNQATLDYLTLDEAALSDIPGASSALPSRGWSDDLCYGTGVTYLSALTAGGAWGLAEGLNRSAGAAPKLQLNSVLNAVTRRGPFLGNSAGVIAMVYNGVNSTIGYYRGQHDVANSVVAGAVSGMLFKCTRGVRPMMISGGLVAGAAGLWATGSQRLFRGGFL
ncbi:MAG: Mitochondrial import inner membrane translocase subunit tim23 [Trizodia sp. TS-e1964]|nr:MAG: Mitochondrial import inner membrane translocase subunit tim23 [Trizodia sp. TS-e1964]